MLWCGGQDDGRPGGSINPNDFLNFYFGLPSWWRAAGGHVACERGLAALFSVMVWVGAVKEKLKNVEAWSLACPFILH
jgi:hypothetical protein